MKVVNIVATAELSAPLNLDELEGKLKDSEKSEKGVIWLKMRLKPEGYYIAFYRSGKFLITGVKSPEEVRDVAGRVHKILRDAGVDVDLKAVKLQNFVCMERLELGTTLEKLAMSLDSEKASYEPEQFPGLLYRDWGASFILFANGKCIITGTKSEKEARNAFNNLKELIEEVS